MILDLPFEPASSFILNVILVFYVDVPSLVGYISKVSEYNLVPDLPITILPLEPKIIQEVLLV